MSIGVDPKSGRFRWFFKATINGREHRLTKLLPPTWSRRQADAYDQKQSADTYRRLSEGGTGFIDEAVALYLEHQIPEQKDGKHAARCLAYMLEHYEGRRLDELGDVSRAVTKAYRAEGLADRTIHQRLAYLRAAAYYALEKHRLGKVEWILQMELPSADKKKTAFMKRADILRLARACKDRETRAWILMTFGTGSRPGECHRASPCPDGLFLGEDKNGNPIIKPVLPSLQRYLRYWPLPFGYSYYSKRFREARKAVGLDRFTPHDGRHATASALIDQGASLAQVAHILDHRSINSTNQYSHLMVEAKRRLLAGLRKKRPSSLSSE